MKPHSKILRVVDVVGVGINATDTIIRLPHFPKSDSKIEVISSSTKAGGQVASAIVACSRWGLKTRYVGKIGSDEAGLFQRKEMLRERVDARWIMEPDSSSQTSYILVGDRSGERTVLWIREMGMALRRSDIRREWIADASILLVDGHDTAAAARAAQWAHDQKIPVLGDFDNRYPGINALLKLVDFPITSRDFPERITGDRNLLRSLPAIFTRFKNRLIVSTLGSLGALAWDGEAFTLCRGFRVPAVDTTGAGDIFHGAFAYTWTRKLELHEALEFSCAAAALNCTAVGARGGIPSLSAIGKLRSMGDRSPAAYSAKALLEARDDVGTRNIRGRL